MTDRFEDFGISGSCPDRSGSDDFSTTHQGGDQIQGASEPSSTNTADAGLLPDGKQEFVRSWVAKHQRGLAASAAGAAAMLPAIAMAATVDGQVPLSAIRGVSSAEARTDGSVSVRLSNGREVVLPADRVAPAQDGQLLVSQEVANQVLAEANLAASAAGGGTLSNILLYGLPAVALGGLAAAAGGGGGGGGDSPAPDTTAPVFQSAAANAAGTKIILTYNEALSASTAASGAFTVQVNGNSATVSSVAVVGSTVELTMATPVMKGQTVTVAYTDANAGNDASGVVQDSAGNDAASLAASSVTTTAVTFTLNQVGGVYVVPSGFGDVTVELVGSNYVFTPTSGVAQTIPNSGAGIQISVADGVTLTGSLATISAFEITGAGNVYIDALDLNGTSAPTLIQVNLSGGDITFDMPADDNDVIVLAAGSYINLGGGIFIVDHGDVDVDAATLSGIGGFSLNSGLRISYQMLQSLGPITITTAADNDPGRLNIIVQSPEEAQGLADLISSLFDVAPILTLTPVNDDPAVLQEIVDTIADQTPAINTIMNQTLPQEYLDTLAGSYEVVTNPPETESGDPISFTAEIENSTVIFDGTATGPIFISMGPMLDTDPDPATPQLASATFSRAGVTASAPLSISATTVIDVEIGTDLFVTFTDTANADTFVINAPHARSMTLRGTTNINADEIVISVADPDTGVEDAGADDKVDLRVLTLDTSGLLGVDASDKIVFAFAGAEDEVALTADSVLTGFQTIEVQKGALNLRSVDIAVGIDFIVNSTLILTLDQFEDIASVVSVSGLGKLTIALTDDSQIADLNAFLVDQGLTKPVLIGTDIKVSIAEAEPVAIANVISIDANAALEAISYEDIPALEARVVALEGDVANLETNLADLTLGVLGVTAQLALTIDSEVANLENADTLLDGRVTDLEAQLAGITTTVVAYVDAAVADLQDQIDDLAIEDIAGLTAALGTLTTAVSALQAADIILDGRVDALEAQLAGIETTVVAYVDSQVTLLEGQIEVLQGQIDTLEIEDIAGLVDALAAINERSDSLFSHVNILIDRSTWLEGRIGGLEAKLAGIESTVVAYVDAAVADLQDQIDNLAIEDIAGLVTALGNLNDAVSALQAADIALDGRVDALEAQLAGIESTVVAYVDTEVADLQAQIDDLAIEDIAGLVTALDELNGAVSALQDADIALGGRVDALEAQLAGIETTVVAYVDAEVADLQAQIDNLAIADIAGLVTALDELNGAVSALQDADIALDGRVDALEAQLAGIETTVVTYVTDQIDAVQGNLSGSDYSTIKALSDAVRALENDHVAGDFVTLLETLQGRGTLMTVADAKDLQSNEDDPLGILLTNYRIEDTASNILAINMSNAADATAVNAAKDIIVSEGTISSAADAAKLVSLDVNLNQSTYDVEGSAATLTTYSGANAFPEDVLSDAQNITVTGTSTTYNQAITLMGVRNEGTTTFENINVTYAQAASLPIDANDVIEQVTITGLSMAARTVLIDLSDYSLATDIVVAGRTANEEVLVKAATPDDASATRVLVFNGGVGSDRLYIVEATDEAGDPLESVIRDLTFNGGSGNDRLVIVGSIDISDSTNTLTGVETLVLETGSPSYVTLTADQLAGFDHVEGTISDDVPSDSSVIEIKGSEEPTIADIAASGTSFSDVAGIVIGENITLKLTETQFAGAALAISGAGSLIISGDVTGQLDLSAVTVTVDLTGLTGFIGSDGALAEDGGTGVVILPGDPGSVILTPAQANGLLIAGEGTIRISTDITSDTDLSGIGSNWTISFADDDAGTGPEVSVGSGATLTLRADQAAGKTITGDGSVAITALEDAPSGSDFSLITTSTVTLQVSGGLGDIEIAPDAELGAHSLSIGNGTNATITAAQADGRVIGGPGGLVVSGLGAETNLSNLASLSSLTVTVEEAELDITNNPTLTGVETYVVAAGSVLTMTAAQADGVATTGLGSVEIINLKDVPTADLSWMDAAYVHASVELDDETVSFDGDLGSINITLVGTVGGGDDVFLLNNNSGTAYFRVENSAILRGAITKLNDVVATVTGEGSVIEVTDTNPAQSFDLSSITVENGGVLLLHYSTTGTYTSGGVLGDAQIVVDDGVTLTMDAQYVTTRTISGEGTAALEITGVEQGDTGRANVDLSNVDSTTLNVTVEIGSSIDLTQETSFAAVDEYVLQGAAAPTYQFYKVLFPTVEGGSILTEISEIAFLQDGTAINVAQIDSLSVVGYFDTDYPSEGPDSAIDGNTGTKYLVQRTDDGAGLIVEFTSALNVNGLSISAAGDFGRCPTSYEIYASSDGVNYTLLNNGSISNNGPAAPYDPISFANEAPETVLTINADMVDGRAVSGAGSLVVVGLQEDTDLSGVSVVVTDFQGDFAPTDPRWGDGGSPGTDVVFSETEIAFTGQDVGQWGDVYVSYEGVGILEAGTISFRVSITGSGEFQYWYGSGEWTTAADGEIVTMAVVPEDGFGLRVARTGDGVGSFDATVTEFSFTPTGALSTVTATVVDAAVDITDNVDLDAVTTFEVEEGSTLTLTAAQANGRNSSGAGTTAVVDLQNALDADLSALGSQVVTALATLEESVIFTGMLGAAEVTLTSGILMMAPDSGGPTFEIDDTANLGSATFIVEADAILQGSAVRLHGKVADGAGKVIVTNLLDKHNADLSSLETDEVEVAVTLSDENFEFQGKLGTAVVTINGASGGDEDIFDVRDAIDVSSATFDVGADAILAGSAVKLHGVPATGDGTVRVIELEDALDADLSGLHASTVYALIELESNSLTFTGDLGKAAVTITGSGGATLTLADEVTLTAPGVGAASFIVGENAVLAGSATLLDGYTVSGDGAVRVTGLESAIGAYLGNMSAATVTATVTIADETTVMFTGYLGDAAVTITGTDGSNGADTFDVTGAQVANATFTVGADATLKIAGDQVGGRAIDGSGHLIVQGLQENTNLSGATASQYILRIEDDFATDYGSRADGDYAGNILVQRVDLSEFVGETVTLDHIFPGTDATLIVRAADGHLAYGKEDETLTGFTVSEGDYVELTWYSQGATPPDGDPVLRLDIIRESDDTLLFSGEYVLAAAGAKDAELTLIAQAGGLLLGPNERDDLSYADYGVRADVAGTYTFDWDISGGTADEPGEFWVSSLDPALIAEWGWEWNLLSSDGDTHVPQGSYSVTVAAGETLVLYGSGPRGPASGEDVVARVTNFVFTPTDNTLPVVDSLADFAQAYEIVDTTTIVGIDWVYGSFAGQAISTVGSGLSSVTATIDDEAILDITLNSNLDAVTVFELGDDATLTLTAAQADGKDATGASGTVIVTRFDTALAADLTGLVAGTVQGQVGLANETLTFTGQLGNIAVSITGVADGAEDIFDVSGAQLGTATFSVGADAVLRGTASSLDGVSASGLGTVRVTALENAVGAELDGLTATTVTASITVPDGAQVTFTGNLGNAAVTVMGTDDASAEDMFDVTGATLGNAATFTVDADATLRLSAAQADGRTIDGAGKLIVAGLTDMTDLSGVVVGGGGGSSAAEDFTGDFAPENADWWPLFNADNGTDADVVINGTTITLTGDSVGQSGYAWMRYMGIEGGGTITFDVSVVGSNSRFWYYDGNDQVQYVAAGQNASVTINAYDGFWLDIGTEVLQAGTSFETIVSNFAFTPAGASGLSDVVATIVDPVVDITGNDNLDAVTEYQVEGGAALQLLAEQANGSTVTGDGTAVISGDVTANADLTSISATLSFNDELDEDGIGTISVTNGVTLTLTAEQASGQVITGNGTVRVTGALPLGEVVDLAGISASTLLEFDLDGDGTADTSITLALNTSLRMGTAQLDSIDITVDGGALTLVGLENDSNLSQISGTGTVTVEVTANRNIVGNINLDTVTHFVVAEGQTLELSALQLDALTGTVSGGGDVVVRNLEAVLDLDFTVLTNGVDGPVTDRIAYLEDNGTFTGDLNDVVLRVNPGKTLTISADKADGKYIEGMDAAGDLEGGSIIITGLTAGNYDFNTIAAGAGTEDLAAGTVSAQIAEDMTLSGALGSVLLSVNDGVTVSMSPTAANGVSISGLGTVNINGDIGPGAPQQIDLTAITAALQFNGGATDAQVLAGSELTLTVAQADGRAVTGFGTLIVTGDVITDTVDLRNATVTTLSFADDGEATPTIDVLDGTTLQLTAAQASGKSITGDGTIEVHGVTDTTDLSDVAAALAFLKAFVDDGVDLSANANLGTVDTFYLTSDEAVVTFSADQVAGKTVYLDDGVVPGTVVISGSVASGTVDLTGIATGIGLTLAGDSIMVGDGATLQLTLAQAAGLSAAEKTIEGEGTLLLEGGIANGETLDLTTFVANTIQLNFVDPPLIEAGARLIVSLASANNLVTDGASEGWINLTGDVPAGFSVDISTVRTNPGNFSFNEPGAAGNGFVIPEGSSVYARPDQVDGIDITGTGTLFITNDTPVFGINLANVTADINLLSADLADGLPTFAEGGLVDGQTLAAYEADFAGLAFNINEGDLVLYMDQSEVSGDFSGITGSAGHTFTLHTDGLDINFTGNRGGAIFRAEYGARVTMTAADANGVTLAGDGSLLVTGDVAAGETLDLTSVTGYRGISFDEGDGNTIEVGAGGLLRINATWFTAGSTSLNIMGEGAVEILDAAPATQYDFSRVATNSVTVSFATSGIIHADTDFTGVAIIELAAGTTTMTAEQAAGIAFTGSDADAAVEITGSLGVQSLFGTQGDDLFNTGGNADTVDVGTTGGSDTIRFTGDSADVTVLNFKAGATADGGDILDFSLIAGIGTLQTYRAFDSSLEAQPEGYIGYFTESVIGLLVEQAGTAAGVENAFRSGGQYLNNQITANSQGDMVFLMSNADGSAVNVWYWDDGSNAAPADKNVTAAELTLLGTLDVLSTADLEAMQAANLRV